ncbi:hypothetical protein SCAR479_14059, partial [Seiridium cardinale]
GLSDPGTSSGTDNTTLYKAPADTEAFSLPDVPSPSFYLPLHYPSPRITATPDRPSDRCTTAPAVVPGTINPMDTVLPSAELYTPLEPIVSMVGFTQDEGEDEYVPEPSRAQFRVAPQGNVDGLGRIR